jgi:hypothetical protein
VRLRGVQPAGLALAIAIPAIAAGCGALIGPGTVSSSSCISFASDGVCSEQTNTIAGRHPGAKQIDLTCTTGICDRKGGAGTAVVTMGDGSVVRDTFSYAGDATPMPAPICVRIGIDACRAVAVSAFNSAPPSRRVVSIRVTCDSPPCTSTKGDATYVTTFGDGGTDTSSVGWDGGLP